MEQTSKSYHGHRERCALCLQTLVLTMFDLDPVHTSSGDPGACDCSLYSWKMAQVDNLRMIRILNDVGLALALHCRQIQERDEALCKASAELQRLCLNGVPPLTGEKLLRIQCDIGDNTKAVSAFLSNLTDPKAVQSIVLEFADLESRATAQKVFRIPELTERILAFLPTQDLVRAEQANLLFRDVIARSSQLMSTLFRRPDADSNFRVFFGPHGAARGYSQPRERQVNGSLEPELYYEYPGFSHEPWLMDTAGPREAILRSDFDSPGVHIDFSCIPNRTDKIRVGSRIRGSHFCQPPIKTLQLRTDCCNAVGASACARFPKHLKMESFDEHECPPASPFVFAPDGWTIGDLLEVTAIVCKAHELCPDGKTSSMDKDGYVRCEVCFYQGRSDHRL